MDSRPRPTSCAPTLRGAPSLVPSPGQPQPTPTRDLVRRKPSKAGAGAHTPASWGGEARRACPRGRDGPRLTSAGFSSVLSRPRLPRPALRSSAQPWAGVGVGGRPLCHEVARPTPCVWRTPSAGGFVCPSPSVLVCPAAALWALDAGHFTLLGRGPRALSGPCGDAPPRRGPAGVPFPGGLRTTVSLSRPAFVNRRIDKRPEGWSPQIY